MLSARQCLTLVGVLTAQWQGHSQALSTQCLALELRDFPYFPFLSSTLFIITPRRLAAFRDQPVATPVPADYATRRRARRGDPRRGRDRNGSVEAEFRLARALNGSRPPGVDVPSAAGRPAERAAATVGRARRSPATSGMAARTGAQRPEAPTRHAGGGLACREAERPCAQA